MSAEYVNAVGVPAVSVPAWLSIFVEFAQLAASAQSDPKVQQIEADIKAWLAAHKAKGK